MSGFALVVNGDRAPVDRRQLECLARAQHLRAPDGEQVRQLDAVGFAFARMQVAGDPPTGDQPLCLDDRWWIVAHARLYERRELVTALRQRGADASVDAADAW